MLLEVQFYCQRFVILHFKSLFLEFSLGITAFDHGNHVFLFHNQQNKFTIHQYSLSTISNIIATSKIPSNMSNLISIKLDHNNYIPWNDGSTNFLLFLKPILWSNTLMVQCHNWVNFSLKFKEIQLQLWIESSKPRKSRIKHSFPSLILH